MNQKQIETNWTCILNWWLNNTEKNYFLVTLKYSNLTTSLKRCTLVFSKCGLRPPETASCGNWWEMQILGSQPRPAESETLRVRPSNLHFNEFFRWFWCTPGFENFMLWLYATYSTFVYVWNNCNDKFKKIKKPPRMALGLSLWIWSYSKEIRNWSLRWKMWAWGSYI